MSIFDVFKKDGKKKNVKIEESKVKEAVNENVENTENSADEEINIDDIITQSRYKEMIERIYKDGDHGVSMMKQCTLIDNIFVLGYIENVIMPDLKEKNKESEFYWFQTTMLLYRKIFYDKISSQEKLWKIVSKTTGFPFIDRGCEHLLVCEDNIDIVIENLKKMYYDVEIIELTKDHFKEELSELFRLGYKGMGFSDGIHRPYYMSKESLVDFEKVPVERFYVNPYTQYSMISFFQEIRRNVNYEGAEKIRQNLEIAMINGLINSVYIVPLKKNDDGQAQLPVYIASKNEEKGTVRPGLYVFTDKAEMKELEKRNVEANEKGWETGTYTFVQLMNLVDEAHISEICINCESLNFKLNHESIEVLKRQFAMVKDKIQEKKDEWETVELPKMIKDKSIPMIKDFKEAPIFARNQDSVLMSKFVFDILSERGLKKDIMEFFFNDEEIKTVYLYDFDFRRIALSIKDTEKKNGMFIMPMRYDDENEDSEINDTAIHYTEDAQKIKSRNDETAENQNSEKTMHFYTIENKNTHKTYLPLFSDEKEAEKVYSRKAYRYCMVSYKDVMDKVEPYDGVVINPSSMSYILEKNLLDNIFDIENK
ncbi:MAG: SseB family protein [Clostridium sp.]